MTNRKELRGALAKTEAALANAVISAAGVDGDRAQADADTEKLRACCRRLQAALVEVKHREPAGRAGEEPDIRIRQLLEVSRRMPDPSPPSRHPGERPVRARSNGSLNGPGRRDPVRRFNTGFSPLKLGPRDALAWYLLRRQATGFLILILAYLEFFYIDIQLQIASLRSIFG